MRYVDHYRTRDKAVTFRLTPEEYRQMEEQIKITGLAKSEFMIQSMFEQKIEIRVGKFESDRLSLEVRRLKDALNSTEVPEEAIPLLLECRALMEQFIQITNETRDKKRRVLILADENSYMTIQRQLPCESSLTPI